MQNGGTFFLNQKGLAQNGRNPFLIRERFMQKEGSLFLNQKGLIQNRMNLFLTQKRTVRNGWNVYGVKKWRLYLYRYPIWRTASSTAD